MFKFIEDLIMWFKYRRAKKDIEQLSQGPVQFFKLSKKRLVYLHEQFTKKAKKFNATLPAKEKYRRNEYKFLEKIKTKEIIAYYKTLPKDDKGTIVESSIEKYKEKE